MSVAIGTVVDAAYLPFARVLARSLQKTNPGVECVVLLVDGAQHLRDDEPFATVLLEDLAIEGLADRRFVHDRQQLVVAGKPLILRYLLEQGHDVAVFLDADILVTGPLGPLLTPPADASIVLTPHITAPLVGADAAARERQFLISGVFNGGAIAVRRSRSTDEFLTWLDDRLTRHCVHDVVNGAHYDQRWLDLVPRYFEGVNVERDPGLNVAYWNLPERRYVVERLGRVGARHPLRFLHFSGFEPSDPDRLTRYHPERRIDEWGDEVADWFVEYAAHLRDAGLDESTSHRYRYADFNDGTPIPRAARRLWELLADDMRAGVGDPFDIDHFTRVAAGMHPGTDVARIWLALHDTRADLRAAYPQPRGRDEAAFAEWIACFGRNEHPELTALEREFAGARER